MNYELINIETLLIIIFEIDVLVSVWIVIEIETKEIAITDRDKNRDRDKIGDKTGDKADYLPYKNLYIL